MKKLLLGTAAIAMGLTVVAGSAQAQVKLDLGGHVKAYTSWLDQDTTPDDPNSLVAATNESEDERSFDILRESELHFSGETTLDNGLTVGVHMEADVDGSTGDNFTTEEGYAYFSGAWGRVNFGLEDGAAYLLQVAAPSADSNFDGIRQWVNPVNTSLFANGATNAVTSLDALTYATAGAGGDNVTFDHIFGHTAFAADENVVFSSATNNTIIFNRLGWTGITASNRFDYDHAVSGYNNKLTYMTPVFNGFQAGVSYTPEINRSADFGNNDDDDVLGAVGTATDAQGTGTAGAEYGDIWDIAARYEGQFDEVGIAFGGGWTHAELEASSDTPILFRSANTGVPAITGAYVAGVDQVIATIDDREAWNVGIDLDWKAFGLGASYSEDDNGVSGDNFERETWVVGLDYTTGPFKIGGSYLDMEQNAGGPELEVERWTGGVVYTYGPGMTFRGSVSWVDLEENIGFRNGDADATSVLLGTQINF